MVNTIPGPAVLSPSARAPRVVPPSILDARRAVTEATARVLNAQNALEDRPSFKRRSTLALPDCTYRRADDGADYGCAYCDETVATASSRWVSSHGDHVHEPCMEAHYDDAWRAERIDARDAVTEARRALDAAEAEERERIAAEIRTTELALRTVEEWTDAKIIERVAFAVTGQLRESGPQNSARLLYPHAVESAVESHGRRVRAALDAGRSGLLHTLVTGGDVPGAYGYPANSDALEIETVLRDGAVVAHAVRADRIGARSGYTRDSFDGPELEHAYATRAGAERAIERLRAADRFGDPDRYTVETFTVSSVAHPTVYLARHDLPPGTHILVEWFGRGNRHAGQTRDLDDLATEISARRPPRSMTTLVWRHG